MTQKLLFLTCIDEAVVVKKLIDSKHLNQAQFKLICWDRNVSDFLDKNNLKNNHISKYIEKVDFDLINFNLMQLIKSFPHKKVINNKSLVELLDYDGVSPWWLIRQSFYSHCSDTIRKIYSLREIIKFEKPAEIILIKGNTEFEKIVKGGIKKTKIKLRVVKNTLYMQKSFILMKKLFKTNSNILITICLRSIRFFQGLLRFELIKRYKDNKIKILIFSQAHTWSTLFSKGSKEIKGDMFSYCVFEELKKRGNFKIIALDTAVENKTAWSAIKSKGMPFIPLDYFIIKSLFNIKIKKKLNNYRGNLKGIWKLLRSSEKFRKSLTFDNIVLFPFLEDNFRSYFFNNFWSLLSGARNIEMIREIIKQTEIDVMIASDENASSRFMVAAAKLEKIPIMGLQHGIVHKYHISYSYSKEDLYGYRGLLNCPLCDKTAVYGKYFENILIKYGNYKKEMISITGQPRTDLLLNAKNLYTKESLLKKFNIKKGDKIIVFASQKSFEWAHMDVILKEFYKYAKFIKNLKIIVKLKPIENSGLHKKIAAKFGMKVIEVKDMDLYELIYPCDAVISIDSTVMLEALLLDKPVIKLNFHGVPDSMGYSKSKVVKTINQSKDIPKVINEVLYNKLTRERLKRERKKYINNFFHKIDGKASKRFVDVIEKLDCKRHDKHDMG